MERDEELRDLQAANDFLLAYASDVANGNRSSVSDYVRRFPGAEDLIEKEYARLQEAVEETVGPYRVGEELGRGAFGTVSLAVEQRTGRQVALKVVRLRGHGDRNALARLRREAHVMTRIDDPRVCPIYDVGWDGEVGWIAMRYIRGASLAALIRAARDGTDGRGVAPESVAYGREPAERDFLVRLFEQAARGLHRVHQAGFVHRDLKPGNIMVDVDGGPVLLDFGLVRALDAESLALTGAEDVLGTPAYVAPEVVRSGAAAADARSDVYGLGVALYEALTLAKPFRSVSREALTQAILDEGVPDPRTLRKDVSRDLAVVVRTACERNPDRRYATAEALATDLRNVREGRPIEARPVRAWVQLARTARRHAAASTGIVLVLLTLVAVAVRERAVATTIAEERDEASRNAHRAMANFFAGLSARVGTEFPDLATYYALRSYRMVPSSLARSMLYAAFQRQHAKQVTYGAGWPSALVAARPSGTEIAYAGLERDVFVCDVERGLVRHHFVTGGACVQSLDLAEEGGVVAAVTEDSGLWTWDARTGEAFRRGAAEDGVRAAALSADGERVCVALADGRCEVRGVGGEVITGLGLYGRTASIAWDAAGVRIGLLETSGAIRVFRAETGEQVLEARLDVETMPAAQGSRARLEWLHGGQLLAFLPGAGAAMVDSVARRMSALSEPGSTTGEPAVDPSRRYFAVPFRGAAGTRVSVFDVERRQRHLVTDVPPLDRLAVSPGGRWLVVSSTGASQLDWIEVKTGLRGRLTGHRDPIQQALFLGDGQLVTTALDGSVRLWDLVPPPQRGRPAPAEGATGLALSRDGKRALVQNGAVLTVVDTATGAEVSRLDVPNAARLRFAGPQRVLAALDDQFLVYSCEGELLRTIRRSPGVVQLGEDPSGRWLPVIPAEGPALVYDLDADGGEPPLRIGSEDDRIATAWVDADTGLIVTADGERNTARTWSLSDAKLVAEREGLGAVWHASLDPESHEPRISSPPQTFRSLPGPRQSTSETGGVQEVESGVREHPRSGLRLEVSIDVLRLVSSENGADVAKIAVPNISDAALADGQIVVIDLRGAIHTFPIPIAGYLMAERLVFPPWPAALIEDAVVEYGAGELFDAAMTWLDAGRGVQGALACVPWLAPDQREALLRRVVRLAPGSFGGRANLAIHLRLASLDPARPDAERARLAEEAAAELATVRELPVLRSEVRREAVQLALWSDERRGAPEILEMLRVFDRRAVR